MSKYGTMLTIFVFLGGTLWLATLEGSPANPIEGIDDGLQDPDVDPDDESLLDRLSNFVSLLIDPNSSYAFVTFLILFPIAGIATVFLIDTAKDVIPFT